MSAWFSSGFGMAAASVGVVGAGGIVGMVALQGGLGGPETSLPAEPPVVAAAPVAPVTTPEQESDAAPTPAPEVSAPAPDPAAPVLPAFDLVRVDPQGNTVIAGRAAAGADVRVMIDGVEASQAVADPGGNFAALFTVPSATTPRVVRLEMSEPGRDPVRSAATVILAPSLEARAGAPEALQTGLPAAAPETGALRPPGTSEQADVPGASEAPLADASPMGLGTPDTGTPIFTVPEALATEGVAVAGLDRRAPTPASELEQGAGPGPDIAPATEERPAALPLHESPGSTLAAEALRTAAPLGLRGAEEPASVGTDLAQLPTPSSSDGVSVRFGGIGPGVAFGDPSGLPGQGALETILDPASITPAPPLGPTGLVVPPQGRADETSAPSDLTIALAPDVPRQSPETVPPDAPEQAADPSERGVVPRVTASLGERPGAPDVSLRADTPGAETVLPTSDQPEAPTVLLADEDGVRVLQPGGITPVRTQSVVIDTISYTPQGEVALGGRGSGEGFVRVYLNNEPIKTTEIGLDGQWRTPLPEVDTGVYTLRVDEIGADGRVRSRVETPFKREEPEVVAALDTRPEGADEDTGVITVQPGNTLWGIATERYGEGLLYVRVFRANRDRIRDPDLIYPGQVFTIPE